MATTRPRSRRGKTTPTDAAPFAGVSDIIPGEVLLTLAPGAADAMTASVPTIPARFAVGVAALGVDDLDSVLSDLGAHDIARIGLAPVAHGDQFLATLDTTGADDVLARTFRVRIAPDADVEAAVDKLAGVGSVEVAEPNRYRFTSVVPNDPRYAEEWGLPKINAPQAWDSTTGSASVVVAVVDTGADLSHPDLVGNLVPGYDMVDLGTNPTPPAGWRFEGDFSGRDGVPADEVGHGTHVAGTIAAVSNNALGVAGVAWQCKIMPVKALTRLVRIADGAVSGTGSSADVAAAIRYAADNGASAINLSLGSSSSTTVEANAVAYAVGKGVVVVAAMGNDGSGNPSYPAAYPDVVSVGAIDSAEKKASFSQTGSHIDVVAPGVGILSTVPGGTYGTKSGTSMATPHVAGVAALIRSVKPTATVAEVTDILRTTAKPLRDVATDPIPNDRYGWGLVDAAAAVAKAAPPVIVKTAICPVTQPIFCHRTISWPLCGPIKTIRLDCLKTVAQVNCNILTLSACPPISQRCPTTITTPITTIRTIGTIRTRYQGQGYGADALGAYDPYGYFGAQQADAAAASGVGAGDGGDDAEAAYLAGYNDGYAAAWAELQAAGEQAGQQAATEGVQPDAADASAPTDADAGGGSWAMATPPIVTCPPLSLVPPCPPQTVYQPGCWPPPSVPLSACGVSVRPSGCLPQSVFVPCPPVTVKRDCFPTINTVCCVASPYCGTTLPPTTTRITTATTTVTTGTTVTTTRTPTLGTTVQTPGTSVIFPGLGWAADVTDPYGQSPFGG